MKITEFPKHSSELEIALHKLSRDMPTLIEYQALKSKLIKKHYDALIAEGFTEQQALELCRAAI